MNARIKARWLKALRSGRYRQGQKQLRTENGFCCLGVLCDLARRSGVADWNNDGHFDGEYAYLPESVVEWAGLNTQDPKVIQRKDLPKKLLSTLNDSGKSFKQIALYIEKSL